MDTSGYRDLPDGGRLLTAALEHIFNAIPSLSSLKVSRGDESEVLSWTMPSFKSMHDLDITPRLAVAAPALAVIGQFQHLRTLSVRISDDCAHLQGCLHALTQLSIGGHAVHIQSFFAAMSPPCLESLGLFFMQDPNTECLTECISVVLATILPTLSALVLESKLSPSPPLVSAMDVVRPALALHSLTHFTLKFKPLPPLPDADLSAMLSVWPLLGALRIPDDCHPTIPRDTAPPGSRPTACILPMIAARCPHLRTLELPEVDLDATPPLDALPPLLWPGHGLRALDLASRCGNRHACMRAAAMLDRLFPRMRLPLIRGYGHNDYDETGWAVVVRLLSAMRVGRANAEAFERARSDGNATEGASGDDGEGKNRDTGLE